MRTFTLLVTLFFVSFGYTQDWWEKNEANKDTSTNLTNNVYKQEGKVVITKDDRIQKMIDFKATTTPPAYGPQIQGYRVQLFFDSDKEKVNAARANFLSYFPNEDTYIEFRAPNFHLKAGNFRSKLEAEKLKSQIIQGFPTSIVVPQKVYYPKVQLED